MVSGMATFFNCSSYLTKISKKFNVRFLKFDTMKSNNYSILDYIDPDWEDKGWSVLYLSYFVAEWVRKKMDWGGRCKVERDEALSLENVMVGLGGSMTLKRELNSTNLLPLSLWLIFWIFSQVHNHFKTKLHKVQLIKFFHPLPCYIFAMNSNMFVW